MYSVVSGLSLNFPCVQFLLSHSNGSNSPARSGSAMAGSISGYTDTHNLDGILFTSKFNKIPKSPAALRHTSNMSRSAIINLDKITQFEHLYSAVRKAHDALLAFMVITPGRYTYRPALCPALRGPQKSPWIPFVGQAPTLDLQLLHKGQTHLPGRPLTSASSSAKPCLVSKSMVSGSTFHWNPAAPCFSSSMDKRSTWKVDKINEKQ